MRTHIKHLIRNIFIALAGTTIAIIAICKYKRNHY